MQITNQLSAHQLVTDSSIILHDGEVYRATIKERLSNNKAILQIRGKEIHAKFEGSLPRNDRVTVEIRSSRDEVVQVRMIAEERRGEQGLKGEVRDGLAVIRKLGVSNQFPELRQAVQLQLDKEVPLTRETVRDLQAYLNSNRGSMQERMETVHALANKKLETTSTQINAVHEALHGRSLGQVITDIAKEIDPDYKFENEKNEVRSGETSTKFPIEQQIRQQLVQYLSQPTIQEKFSEMMEETKKLIENGREMAARQLMMNTLQQIEQQIKHYKVNEQTQTVIQFQSKEMAVTTITQKLAEATAEFKKIQRDITKNLDVAYRLIVHYKNQAIPQVKPLLETTIKQLDNAILKSEMMLWTNMKTEKQLLQASSQLAEAKKHLSKGNYQEANRIVHEVKTFMEKINFKPSETKIMHFVSEVRQQQSSVKSTGQQLLHQINETVRLPFNGEGSVRKAYELIRSLGINRDSELGQTLVSNRENSLQLNNQNLKNTLMQMFREEEASRVSQQVNQALNNVTGQQLLSKSDSGNNQSMLLNIPFLLQEKVENLQVYVNSRNEGERVDWENCSLYFLIETPKLGEIGININVVERNLTVTLKNDKDHFQKKLETLVDLCVEKISDFGYIVNGINYTKMTADENKQIEKKQKEERVNTQPIYTEKGFDFKI